MGSDESGMPVPAFKNSSGTYHMSGCLEVAPEAFLHKRFSMVHRVLEGTGAATIICTLVLPRYVKRPYCNDEVHMRNWPEADLMTSSGAAARPARTSSGLRSRN